MLFGRAFERALAGYFLLKNGAEVLFPKTSPARQSTVIRLKAQWQLAVTLKNLGLSFRIKLGQRAG